MREVRTDGSRYVEDVEAKMSLGGRIGVDVHSIALDLGPADGTGSVSLQRTATGKKSLAGW